MLNTLGRLALVLVSVGYYGTLYQPWHRAMALLNEGQLMVLVPAIVLIPLLTGLLVQLMASGFKLKPSWGKFVLVLIVMGAAIVLSSPLSLIFFGPSALLWGAWGLPLFSAFAGVLLGTTLVGEAHRT